MNITTENKYTFKDYINALIETGQTCFYDPKWYKGAGILMTLIGVATLKKNTAVIGLMTYGVGKVLDNQKIKTGKLEQELLLAEKKIIELKKQIGEYTTHSNEQ